MTDSDNKRLLAALEANWHAEMEGHHTYSALAKREADPQRRNAYEVWPLQKSIMAAFGLDAFWNSVDKCPSTRGVNLDRPNPWQRG
jgi:hypothetical protein